ncbi:MAG: SDR family NAD(P)-dependent oxidoreductase [Bacteroidota bacterium]|nr:SDR family oxidoreductase [Bacteroidota bacterium]
MRRILITGASGGLGQIIAENLIEKGFFVILVANRNLEKVNKLNELHPNQTKVIQKDFLKSFNSEDFANQVGTIDSIIHTLGVSSSNVSWKTSNSEWEKVIKLNLTIPFEISSAFIPMLRENKFGRIIFFSSVVGQIGVFGTTAYSASKSGLVGLTKSLAVELIQKNITVNCIAPGYMNQGMIKEIDDSQLELIKHRIPNHELGNSMNIVNSVLFLLDEKSDYVTGQVINVNGGIY